MLSDAWKAFPKPSLDIGGLAFRPVHPRKKALEIVNIVGHKWVGLLLKHTGVVQCLVTPDVENRDKIIRKQYNRQPFSTQPVVVQNKTNTV